MILSAVATEADLDYLAGFLDADGCFYAAEIRNGAASQPRLAAAGVYPAPLMLARSTWGGSVNGPYEAPGCRRATWSWAVTGRSLDAALSDLTGRLVVKREGAEILAEWRTYGGRHRDERGRWRGTDSRERWEPLMNRLRVLNERGSAAHVADIPEDIEAVSTAYLAGMIDGDGTVSTDARGKPHIAIACVPPIAPAMAHARWGGSLARYASRTPNARPAWVWRVSGEAVRAVAADIYPHLRVKAAQAALVTALLDLQKARGRSAGVAKGINLSNDDRTDRDVLVAALRSLNQRGAAAVA